MSVSLAEVVASLSAGPRPLAVRRRGDAELVDATHDSRQVRSGWLFCATSGANRDGHDFAGSAVEAGAAALLVERWLDLDIPQARVPSVRQAMGPVAAAIHGHPSDRLQVVGVTGTNGKTTTTLLLEAAFGAAGLGTGVIGTIETRIHGAAHPGGRTTPEATDLQRLLATMESRGVDAVAMEVSSHGLHQHRVDGTNYRVAVFTNLSQDHLDYHGTLEVYYETKARLFRPEFAQQGVVCVDDEWGRRLAREATVQLTTFGTSPEAEVRVLDVVAGLHGTQCRVVGPGTNVLLHTPLLGAHNALNVAAAYLAAIGVGVPSNAAVAGIAACEGVRGRLEPVGSLQPFAVLVDYAHTPDALARAVAACRGLAQPGGRVHVVVGCGGERDRSKRTPMGRIAAEADRAVLTSDNPRSEDPHAILAEVSAGAMSVDGSEVLVEPDRRRAIAAAIAGASPGDVVLVAGKGHETTQELADRVVPFDDRAVAAEVLAELGWEAGQVREARVMGGGGGTG
ncbi:MAG: UDP-N-acetylmuramoyl-L-alanyl-D-glutamate--2,6-diaminopimelate ligase [Nitriliruptorales bacterium]